MCTAEYRAPVERERLWCARGTVDTADPDVCQPDSIPCKQHPTVGRSENRLGFPNKSPSADSCADQIFSMSTPRIKKSRD